MNIKDAALSLNEFDKCISEMPDDTLKRDLKQHVHDAYQLLLDECLKRNTKNLVRQVGETTIKPHILTTQNNQTDMAS